MGKASNGNGKLKRGVIENRAVDLALCDAHERNYNRHSDAQIADLRESLRHFGQVRSIVAQQNGKRFLLVAGHGLAQAARLEGFTELRADIIPASWSKTRVLAYLAADNEIARQGSADEAQLAAIVREVMDAEGEVLARLAAGEQKALDALLAQGNAVEETADVGELIDRAAELQKKWKVTRGDIFEVESKTARGKFHRIMCGDSTSKEDVEHIAAKEIRLEWSDPPYEMDTQGGGVMKQSGHLQKITDAGIDHFDPHLLYLVARTSVFCCNKPLLKKYIALADDWKMAWDLGFWKKNNTPPNYGGHLMTDVEYLFVVGEQSPNKGQDKSLYSKAFISDIVTDRIVGWQKPVELVCKFIYLFSTFGEIIFDRFLGSGTTLIACEQTGRIGRGMELEPKYVSVALERLQLLGLEPRRVTETEKRNGKQKRA